MQWMPITQNPMRHGSFFLRKLGGPPPPAARDGTRKLRSGKAPQSTAEEVEAELNHERVQEQCQIVRRCIKDTTPSELTSRRSQTARKVRVE